MNLSSTVVSARVEHGAQWRSSAICHLQTVPAAGGVCEAERTSRRRSWQRNRGPAGSCTASQQQHWPPPLVCHGSHHAAATEQPAAVLFPAGTALPTQPYNTSQGIELEASSARDVASQAQQDAQVSQWPVPAASHLDPHGALQPSQQVQSQQLPQQQGRRARQKHNGQQPSSPSHSQAARAHDTQRRKGAGRRQKRAGTGRQQQQQQPGHATVPVAAASTISSPEIAAATTRRIMSAACVWDLLEVLREKGAHLNAVHVSAMLQKALMFASQDPASWSSGPLGSPIHGRNTAQKGAQSHHRGAHKGHSKHSAAPALQSWYHEEGMGIDDWGMADPDDHYLDSHSTGLSNAPALQGYNRAVRIAQLSRVVHRTASIAGRLAAAKQLDNVCTSMVLTALAKLGYGNIMKLDRWVQEGSSKAAGKLQLRYSRVMDQLLSVQTLRAHGVASRSLTNMIFAVAKEGYQPQPAWMQAWATAMLPHLETCAMHELCTCIYALGKLKYKPSEAFLTATCSRAVNQLGEAKPRDVANFISGLAGMHYLPSSSWVADFLAASAQRIRYFQLSSLHRMLFAFASLGIQPDEPWLAAFYTRCQNILGGDMPQSSTVSMHVLGSMTALLAQLNVRPDMRWMEVCLLHARQGFMLASPADLIQLLGALARLRYRPGDAWMQVCLTRAFQLLGVFTPDQVVSLLSSLSQLSYQPPVIWQQELVRKVQARLREYSADQLAELLMGLARLRCQPSADWLSEWERASQSRMDQFSAGALAATVCAFAELQHQPAVSWLYGYVLAAYGKLDSFDAGQLAAVFEALPHMSHPGWLDELVQICANESIPGGGRVLSSSSFDELDDTATAAVTAASSSTSQVAELQPQQTVAPLLRSMLPFRAVTSDSAGRTNGSRQEATTLRIYRLHNGMGQVQDVSIGGYIDEPTSNGVPMQPNNGALHPHVNGVHASWPAAQQAGDDWEGAMSSVESSLAAADLLIPDAEQGREVAQVRMGPGQGGFNKPQPGQPGSSPLAVVRSGSSQPGNQARNHGMVQVALRSMRQ